MMSDQDDGGTARILRKNFEDTTTRNVHSILEHSNETRKSVRLLEPKVQKLEAIIANMETELKKLRQDVVVLKFKEGQRNANNS